MGTFENSLKRELGKNTGKFISNVIFGDRHSTPYRRVRSSNRGRRSSSESKKIEIECRRQEAIAHADIDRKNQLYVLDGAVLKNIDALNNLDISLEKESLLQLLSKLSVLLKVNKWESGGDEKKIRNRYTDALLEKYRLAVQELEIIDPDDPHLESYKRIYSKQKRRRFLKVYQSAIIALSMIMVGAYLIALAGSPTATLSYTVIFAIAVSFFIGIIAYIRHLLKKKHPSMYPHESIEFQPVVHVEETSHQESYYANSKEEINIQSSIFFDLNENGRIEKRLALIWNKYQGLDYDFISRKPLFAADGVRESVLFVGINPTYDHRDDEIMLHSADGKSLMYGSFYQRDDAPEYFKSLEEFAASLGKGYTQINLLYVRENDRNMVLKSDENYIREQLELTYETISRINPVVIIFFTDYCRYLIFGADRWIDPVTEVDDHYILRGTDIPVLFSDDITILNASERKELINKIRNVL